MNFGMANQVFSENYEKLTSHADYKKTSIILMDNLRSSFHQHH